MSAHDSLPTEADTVIVGAGIIGCSAAYHLTELGRDDVVVVDQGPLPTTGGSSSHAPGIMFQTAEENVLTKFARYSRKLYSQFEDEDGEPLYNETGGIEVARTDERMDFLQRRVEHGTAWGIPGPQILSPEEVEERLPLVDSDVIKGGGTTRRPTARFPASRRVRRWPRRPWNRERRLYRTRGRKTSRSTVARCRRSSPRTAISSVTRS